MEVNLTPELQAKLSRLAAEHGRDTQALAREAIERFVDYDEWFLREVARASQPPTGESSSKMRTFES